MALLGIEELLFNNGPKTTALGLVTDNAANLERQKQEADMTSELLRLTSATEEEKKKAERLIMEEEALKAKEDSLSLELARLTQLQSTREIAPAPIEEAKQVVSLSPQEQRVKKLNQTFQTDAFYQGSNISASVEKDGTISFTNTAPVVNNQKEPVFKPPMAGTEESHTVSEITKALNAVKDASLDNKEAAAEGFRRSAAELELRLVNKALQSADSIYRPEIQQVQRQLEVARVNDQIARMQGLLQGDSKETLQLIEKFDEFDVKIKKKAEELLATSPESQALKVESANFNAHMAGAAKREQQEETRSIAREAKEQAEIDRAAPFLSKARLLLDGMADKTDLEVSRALSNKMLSDKATAEALQAEGDDLVMLALGGNKQAKKLLAKREAMHRGTDEASVLQGLNQVETVAIDSKAIDSYLAEVIPNKEERASYMRSIDPLYVTGAGEKEAARAQKKALGLAAYRKQKENAFISRLDTWQISDPELAKVTRELGESSNLSDVLKVYLGTSIGDERSRKMAIMKEAVRENGRLEAGSAVVQLPADAIANNLESYMFPDEISAMARRWHNLTTLPGIGINPALEGANWLLENVTGRALTGIRDFIDSPTKEEEAKRTTTTGIRG